MEIPGIKIFLFGQVGSEKIEVYKSQRSVLTTDRENYKYKKICNILKPMRFFSLPDLDIYFLARGTVTLI